MQCLSYQLIGRFFFNRVRISFEISSKLLSCSKVSWCPNTLCRSHFSSISLLSQATRDVVLDPFLSALRQPHPANHFLASNSFVSISQAIFSQSQNLGKIIYRTHTSLRQENIFHTLPPEMRQELWAQTIFIFVDSPFH